MRSHRFTALTCVSEFVDVEAVVSLAQTRHVPRYENYTVDRLCESDVTCTHRNTPSFFCESYAKVKLITKDYILGNCELNPKNKSTHALKTNGQ